MGTIDPRKQIDMNIYQMNNFHMKISQFTVLPYSGNVWRGESLENLANEHNFAKLKPSKCHMHVTMQWDYTSIRQAFFRHIIYQINFAKHYRHQTFPLYGIK